MKSIGKLYLLEHLHMNIIESIMLVSWHQEIIKTRQIFLDPVTWEPLLLWHEFKS